jgi:hypothetical protein
MIPIFRAVTSIRAERGHAWRDFNSLTNQLSRISLHFSYHVLIRVLKLCIHYSELD